MSCPGRRPHSLPNAAAARILGALLSGAAAGCILAIASFSRRPKGRVATRPSRMLPARLAPKETPHSEVPASQVAVVALPLAVEVLAPSTLAAASDETAAALHVARLPYFQRRRGSMVLGLGVIPVVGLATVLAWMNTGTWPLMPQSAEGASDVLARIIAAIVLTVGLGALLLRVPRPRGRRRPR